MSNQINKEHSEPIPVTLFTGCLSKSKPQGISTITEILQTIRTDDQKEFVEFSKTLRQLSKTDPEKYTSRKEKECKAFIIGQFTDRKNGACVAYAPMIGFDIDRLNDVPRIIGLLSKIPFIYAAFSSPSGAGVRFLVRCAGNQEQHKDYYKAITIKVSDLIGVPTDKQLRTQWKGEGMEAEQIREQLKTTPHIDTSTNNIARLWFYTWTPKTEFYHNPNSEVFSMNKKGTNSPQLSEDQKISACIDKVKRQSIGSGRNNFVFAFACELAQHGVEKSRGLSECMAYVEKDFPATEIKKTVSSAYQSKKRIYSDAQILKYISLTTNKKAPDIKRPKPTPSATNKKEGGNLPKFIRLKTFLIGRYDFRYNIISNEIESSAKGQHKYKELNENDIICELLSVGFTGVETPLIALLKSSFVPKYDPFKEYFSSLPEWKESDPDHIEQLARYITAKDQDWFNLQFKKALVRTVACALRAMPFNKQCFVLKGIQNDGKSSFIRFLCPPKLSSYITEQINVNNKDGRLTLCQNLIINLDELSQFSKWDINKVKALISVDSVKERLVYDRKPTKLERRASFFGSTNNDEFLTDETGSVRWLIMEIQPKGVKHDFGGVNGYRAINIDQVYSQAYYLLKSGYKYELTRDEIAQSERINKTYQIASIEQELIQDHFAPSTEDTTGSEFLTATDILKAIESEVKTTIHKQNVGRALKYLGFEQSQRFFKEYGYQRKGYWVQKLENEKRL